MVRAWRRGALAMPPRVMSSPNGDIQPLVVFTFARALDILQSPTRNKAEGNHSGKEERL